MFCFCRHGIDTTHLGKVQEKRIKMCLIGASDSGKSTITKQLKHICNPSDEEKDPVIKTFIRRRIIHNMQKLCQQILRSDARFSAQHNMSHIPEKICSLLESLRSDILTKHLAFQIQQLWHHHGLKDVYQQRHKNLQMDDNIEYFMNKVTDIASDAYVASLEDFMRLHARSCGCYTTKFTKCVDHYGTYAFDIVDIAGARSERKKWWKNNSLSSKDLDAIIYCVPIGDYDLTLFEDTKTNRLIESINLWKETMIKADFFHGKQVFVLFNKYDRFVEKIKDIPITCCFDDFPSKINANDPQKVMQFIAGKFLQVFSEHNAEFNGSLHVFRTNAIDTASVESVFNKIIPRIIRRQSV